MIACDNFMNVTLRDVILTAPEGDKFYQMKEVYLKGNVVSLRSWVVSWSVKFGVMRMMECGERSKRSCTGGFERGNWETRDNVKDRVSTFREVCICRPKDDEDSDLISLNVRR